MALQQHIYECIFGMILAMALIIAATTWAFSPNPAAPIPPSIDAEADSHRLVATTLSNLAVLYDKQGRYAVISANP